jgi:hypothetical protein
MISSKSQQDVVDEEYDETLTLQYSTLVGSLRAPRSARSTFLLKG